MTRLEIATRIAEAVRAAIPDRAAIVLSSLEARLDAGRWSQILAPHRPPRELLPRDAVLLEVRRALEHAHGDEGDATLRALERWTIEALPALLDEQLHADYEYSETAGRLARWAADALETGLDSPALRALAGLGHYDGNEAIRAMQLARVELGFPEASEERSNLERGRRIATEFLCSRMTLREAVLRLRRVFGGTDHYDERETPWADINRDLDAVERGRGDIADVERAVRMEIDLLLGPAT